MNVNNPCDTHDLANKIEFKWLGHCYVVQKVRTDWYNGRRLCQTLGGDLASITDSALLTEVKVRANDLLYMPANFISGIWFGLRRSQWTWNNGRLSLNFDHLIYEP